MSDTTTANDVFDTSDEDLFEREPEVEGDEESDGFESLDDLFGDIDFEEYDDGTVRKPANAVPSYDDPASVGLKDGMWVPLQITESVIDSNYVPRQDWMSKICIAVTPPSEEGGKPKVAFTYNAIEEALEEGADEQVRSLKLPYHVVKLNHVAPRFGRRHFDYEGTVPVSSVKRPFKDGNPRGQRTGWADYSGQALRAATGVTEGGVRLTKNNRDELAAKMVGTIVMAKISINPKSKAKLRDIVDEERKQVRVRVNQEDGSPILVRLEWEELGEGEEGFDPTTGEIVTGPGKKAPKAFYEEGGKPYTEAMSLLFPVDDEGVKHAIRDNGEESDILRQKYFVDYLTGKTDWQPVPKRDVTIKTTDGGIAEGEITLDTVGNLLPQMYPGLNAQAMTTSGKLMNIVWLGTEWIEKQDDENNDTFKG